MTSRICGFAIYRLKKKFACTRLRQYCNTAVSQAEIVRPSKKGDFSYHPLPKEVT
jgi:hypothetical protein